MMMMMMLLVAVLGSDVLGCLGMSNGRQSVREVLYTRLLIQALCPAA